VRGLKSFLSFERPAPELVAPFTGAWIEILFVRGKFLFRYVAPFTGAWIEIKRYLDGSITSMVAPFTGAWIEIMMETILTLNLIRRTLHGCVD